MAYWSSCSPKQGRLADPLDLQGWGSLDAMLLSGQLNTYKHSYEQMMAFLCEHIGEWVVSPCMDLTPNHFFSCYPMYVDI